jgi:hypothetical protein
MVWVPHPFDFKGAVFDFFGRLGQTLNQSKFRIAFAALALATRRRRAFPLESARRSA